MPMRPPALHPLSSCHVAVIGAGAAGLVAAKELLREGHRVVVFERGDQLGGTWVYTPEVDSDPLGVDPRRSVVHSSIYQSLRTNLPREAMGFRDFPFVHKHGKLRDPRRFPAHGEVLMYLKDYASEFGLDKLVRFQTEVMRVGLVDDGKWRVRSRKRDDLDLFDEVFDAVVVCNGHYTEPRIADDVPGIKTWPGKQIHSHNYRVPEPFRDQVVVLIGSSASAVDISRDIAHVAKEVHIASRSFEDGATKCQGYNNLWLHSMIQRTHEDGTVFFHDGTVVLADVILHCTGYKYYYPFLETNGIVTVDDNCVGPLYKDVFPPVLAPRLSFVGLPWKVAPFFLCELQSHWIAGVLSGRISLPSQEHMLEDVRAFYAELAASGIPKRYTHNMSATQFEYNDWVAAQCKVSPSEEWRKEMYDATTKNRDARPETYRDKWEDDHLVLQAHDDFKRYT